MTIDASWTALCQPGQAERYFEADPLPALCAVREGYDPAAAWLLAELARLAYQEDPARRREALQGAGLRELSFLAEGSGRALLVAGDACHALLFRGTAETADWRRNLQAALVRWRPGGRVHLGFGAALRALWPAIQRRLRGLDGPLLLGGHSLGGALACLAATRLPHHAVYTFGAPRVGDATFAARLDRERCFRVVHRSDLVPALPLAAPFGFRHGGTLLLLDGQALRVEPPRLEVYVARLRAGLTLPRILEEAPAALADHAPVNYVAALAEQLSARRARNPRAP